MAGEAPIRCTGDFTVRFSPVGITTFTPGIKNRLIAFEDLFAGTIDQVSVYPREIAKQSLKHNASAVIVGHNHPSQLPEPSAADKSITKKIKDVLDTLDIRFLDHIIVGGDDTCSLAERGLI